MSEVTPLASVADAEAMLAASQERPVFVLKNSTTCPISAGARRQYDALDAEGDPARYMVTVQDARPVSTYLAEALDVPHETPQAILVSGGQAVYVESHGAIETSALRGAAEQQSA